MNIVVYTAIFGDIRDRLQPLPRFPDRPEHYVTFQAFVEGVDRPWPDTTGWGLRPAYWHHKNPRLRARRHKALSHQLFPAADITIWLDGCLTPVDDPIPLVEKYLAGHDICVFEHMQRRCVYREAEACKQLRKDRPEVIDTQMAVYRAAGYPPDNGLAETTCVMRRHTPEVRKFNELWWAEMQQHSLRDQLSFDYLLWQMGMNYMTLEGTRTNCVHFRWRPHR